MVQLLWATKFSTSVNVQVKHRACCAARRLRKCGVSSEVVVAVCVDEGWIMVVLQLAVMLAGGAFVPVDLSLPTRCYSPIPLFRALLGFLKTATHPVK